MGRVEKTQYQLAYENTLTQQVEKLHRKTMDHYTISITDGDGRYRWHCLWCSTGDWI